MTMELKEADTVSLAFLEPVVHRLKEPQTVFDSADKWAFNIGILHDTRLLDVINTRREYGVETDFHNGPKQLEDALDDLSSTLETSRHILIVPDEEYANELENDEWEFLSITEAAEAADWELNE